MLTGFVMLSNQVIGYSSFVGWVNVPPPPLDGHAGSSIGRTYRLLHHCLVKKGMSLIQSSLQPTHETVHPHPLPAPAAAASSPSLPSISPLSFFFCFPDVSRTPFSCSCSDCTTTSAIAGLSLGSCAQHHSMRSQSSGAIFDGRMGRFPWYAT